MVHQVIQSRSRREIREAVGYATIGSKLIVSAATSNGTTTTVVDTSLRGGNTEYNGRWLIPRGGTDDGTITRVTGYVAATTTFTITPAVNTDSTASGIAYELWPDDFDPLRVNSLIDQAFINATGRVFDPEQDISLHLQSDVWRYDVPTQFAMISSLQDRRMVSSLLLESCDTVWDTIDTDVTGSADSEIKRRGGASLKLIIAAGAAAGDDLATHGISATDISSYDTVEMWVRATTTTSAGDISLILSDGTIRETLAVPAIATADTWQYVRMTLANPELDTALTTIILDYTTDGGAYTLWVDEIRTFRADSAEWHEIPRHQWGLDVQARDIVFKVQPSYRLLKIIGGDKPALMATDAAVSEIDDAYVESYATSLLRADLAETQGERQFWLLRAEQTKAGLPPLRNVRKFTN